MDESGFRLWLEAYVDAWRSYDRGEIGALFSEDAEYRWHPWEEPARGREAIVAGWLEDRDEPGTWEAEYRPFAIDGETAVAVGVSRYFGPDRAMVEREYHNVFLCRFDGDGRCREFTEVYAQRRDGESEAGPRFTAS